MNILDWGGWVLSHIFNNTITHLQVSVHQPIHVEIVVVLAVGIHYGFGYFEPAEIEYKLENGENGNDIIDS